MATSPRAAVAAPASLTTATQLLSGPIPTDPVVGDDDNSDWFSDNESILAPSTISLSESVTQYRRIHGRTYTQKTEYWGPNDDKQNEALDVKYFNNRFTLTKHESGLHLRQRVLDVGTGTGIWAIDFADKFPSAQVTGVDISPIQPSWIPPNCKFQIDDIENPWGWSPDYFDFIHIRNLEGSVSDWNLLYSQIYRHLKPGGYFEIKEWDIESRSQTQSQGRAPLGEDHIFRRWARTMFDAMAKLGKPGTQTRNHGIADALGAAGFVDIVEQTWSVPIGSWSSDPKLKEVGALNLYYLDESLEGFAVLLLKEVLDWGDAEITEFIDEMRRAIRNRRLAPYITL